jgi:hypothetical protein
MVLIDYEQGAPKASFRQQNGQFWEKTEHGKKTLARRMAKADKKDSREVQTKRPRM